MESIDLTHGLQNIQESKPFLYHLLLNAPVQGLISVIITECCA